MPPGISVQYGRSGVATRMNEKGMRPMQERVWQRRGEQYLLIKSPPASGKSCALMFVALDKLANQGVKQAIIAVPERSIGGSFADADLANHGFSADWRVAPRWNLCNIAGIDDARIAQTRVGAVAEFLASADKVLVCTHATFRFAVEALGIAAFDDRLIAIDEFHTVQFNRLRVTPRENWYNLAHTLKGAFRVGRESQIELGCSTRHTWFGLFYCFICLRRSRLLARPGYLRRPAGA